MTAMEVEVVPRMLENRAFVDLCERMGFKPVAPKPKPPEASKAAKKRKSVKKGVIDWTLPIEFCDGTPALSRAYRGGADARVVSVDGGGELPPSVRALFDGFVGNSPHDVIVENSGKYWGLCNAIIVRNREVEEEEEEKIDATIPQKVDWSKPIEFIDGTPAVIGSTEHSADREDGLPFTGEQLRLFFNGGNTYKKHGVALNGDGSYPSCPPRTWPIRNRKPEKAKRKAKKSGKIDWSKPIEFIDGTPAFVPSDNNQLSDRKRVEVELGCDEPAIMVGAARSMHGGWWFRLDGSKDGSSDTTPLIRNRKPASTGERPLPPPPPKLDWTKPLELDDGTPARLMDRAGRAFGGTNPDCDGQYWLEGDGCVLRCSALFNADGTNADDRRTKVRNR